MSSSAAARAMIFDVDGVLADTPHEESWRLATEELCARPDWAGAISASSWKPGGFTRELYLEFCAGRERRDAARSLLTHFGIPDPEGALRDRFFDEKQRRYVEMLERREFRPYPDGVDLLKRAKGAGWKVAAASSSRNASQILEAFGLRELFDADLSASSLPAKPAPDLFLAAAAELGVRPGQCCVVEDSTSGVRAARGGRFMCLAVARFDNMGDLWAAGANLVTDSLADVTVEEIDLIVRELKL